MTGVESRPGAVSGDGRIGSNRQNAHQVQRRLQYSVDGNGEKSAANAREGQLKRNLLRRIDFQLFVGLHL